jgi:putative chitinase
MISLHELQHIGGIDATSRYQRFLTSLNDAMREFEIDTTPRIAAFIAQVMHESGRFFYVKELASGEAYEGRADLGNTEEGDGVRYKGRGLIQITGRANYQSCGDDLGIDLVSSPELLEGPILACRSAGWFWGKKNLNDLADKPDFLRITKRINGGTNGYQDRLKFYIKAMAVLG